MSDAAPTAATDSSAGLVRALTTATFLQWLGAGAMLPLLPEYLRDHGGSDAVVGAVMGAFFAAGVLVQYPAGWLADRVGRRPVLIAGLLIYAVASAGFLLPVSPALDIALRALQGVGSGMETVAALALMSAAVPLERRGRAVGSIYAGQLAGLAIGPLVGSVAGLAHMNLVFLSAGVASLLACIPVLRTRATVADDPEPDPEAPATVALRKNRAVLGALVAAAALGLCFGVYEACWTLYLEHRGAQDWQVGLSWTLFAIPFVVMARPAGWLADHFDRRRLVVGAITASALFSASYPFIDNLEVLLVLGGVEAIGVAVALPASQSMLTGTVAPEAQGRVQGLYATAETASVAIAAIVGGSMFAVAVWLPFVATAVVAGLLIITLPFIWAPVAGRVARPGPDPDPVELPADGDTPPGRTVGPPASPTDADGARA